MSFGGCQEVAFASEAEIWGGVVAVLWMVERQAHELGKRQRTLRLDPLANQRYELGPARGGVLAPAKQRARRLWPGVRIVWIDGHTRMVAWPATRVNWA